LTQDTSQKSDKVGLSLNNSHASGDGSSDGDSKAEEKVSSEVDDVDESNTPNEKTCGKAAKNKPEKRPVAKKRSREEKLKRTMDTLVKRIKKALSGSDEHF